VTKGKGSSLATIIEFTATIVEYRIIEGVKVLHRECFVEHVGPVMDQGAYYALSEELYSYACDSGRTVMDQMRLCTDQGIQVFLRCAPPHSDRVFGLTVQGTGTSCGEGRVCSKCGDRLPWNQFNKDAKGIRGCRSVCRVCTALRRASPELFKRKVPK